MWVRVNVFCLRQSEEATLEKQGKISSMNRPNLQFIEKLFQEFQNNPESLDSDWRMFFEGFEFALSQTPAQGKPASSADVISEKELDVFLLINAYRDYGYFGANLNPLASGSKLSQELSLTNFGLSEADLDKKFEIGRILGKQGASLREILMHLRRCYCGSISLQVHDATPTIRSWFINEFENNNETWVLSAEEKKELFFQLAKTESLEKFLHTRYVGKKRFSIEGMDSLIPMLERFVKKGSELEIEELVIGMAHRGRLNVLVNFMDKSVDTMFAEFEGVRDDYNSFFDGDVKYHLGYSADKTTRNGNVHLSLSFNPSHLEAVDPVVLGMARAKQRQRKDTASRKKAVPILIHGDAAMAGQGVVAETFQLSQLRGYTVGGCIHIVTDNQVAFTTSPEFTRSSPFSSDISKMLQTPVIHVNADDAEMCVRAADMAVRFRQEFKRDVVVNMIGYRRFGHNEGDEPAFTQPVMYEKIKKHPTAYDIYAQKLVKEGVISDDDPEKIFKARIEVLQGELDNVKKAPPEMRPLAFSGYWQGLRRATSGDFKKDWNTKTDLKILQDAAKHLVTLPPGFVPHPKLKKLLEQRTEMMKGEGHIDWGMAELLTYGSLLYEGSSVRLSGQDVMRGTFTHRHAGYYDIKTNECYMPFSPIRPKEVEFVAYNSPLSEYGVLGFEFGNSTADPTYLNIWEAQFGDFANGAQIIIDQFIASAEQKWQRMSGLVLLLPHGYEGQGPEHSSARLERFLQLAAQDNMQVCNLTTPAQLFHVLRRQMKRDFRKPLIIMSPKSLLRHPKVFSTLNDLYNGTFHEVIQDEIVSQGLKSNAVEKIETLILCSGKIYYHILDGKEKTDKAVAEKVAVARLEQIYPFPEHKLAPVIAAYPNLKRVMWTQEEPKNMAAWFFVAPLIRELLAETGSDIEVVYNGRSERASPATGCEKVHFKEQEEIVKRCFNEEVSGVLKMAKKTKLK